MILPTKALCEERSLLFVGAEILNLLNQDKTVSRLWDEYKVKRKQAGNESSMTYDWFVLSLDLLYIMGTINIKDGLVRRSKLD